MPETSHKRGIYLLATKRQLLAEAIVFARPFDTDAILTLYDQARAVPTLRDVVMSQPDEHGVITISGTVPNRPAGYFAIKIVPGPETGQMVGGLIVGRTQAGQVQEESEWKPLKWDYLLMVLTTWAA